MFRFENDIALYYLAGLIPLTILLYVGWMWHRHQERKLGEAGLIDMLKVHTSPYRAKVQNLVLLLIFTFLVIAWANPQWGAKREKVKARSTDIFVALDISNSMYCEDVAPSRMDVARKFAFDLIEELKGERMGLILFAGNAYLQMPLTRDYAAAQIFVRSANPGLAGTQGTALADAIGKAEESFTTDENYHRALIIITDGEDHDPDALSAAEAAREKGLLVFTVGVGTPEGSYIPIQVRGNEDWKRDETGQPVRTRLNETLLRELAETGGGDYFRLSQNRDILSTLNERVATLEKQEFEERSFTEYESYFQLFLGIALLLYLYYYLSLHRLIPKLVNHA